MPITIRLFFLLIILAAAAGGLWYAQQQSPLAINRLTETLEQTREIIAPPPLRGPREQIATTLTRAGVFTETNRHRAVSDLPALAANTTLDRAAQAKVNDMFTQQYFEHVGPDGRGPATWVDDAGYRYIRVGENLALGNFSSDAALVQAWMDSPGHRANILHTGYSEIGIAVGRGNFEGQSTWLAVQTFALPQSACPTPDAKLAGEIERLQATIGTTNAQLDQQQDQFEQEKQALQQRVKEIEALFDRAGQKIAEGNAKITEGNRIYQETGSKEQAQPYWDEGEQLQQEGEALLEQARQQQTAYNESLADLRARQQAYNDQIASGSQNHTKVRQLIATYNEQVKKFNACAK